MSDDRLRYLDGLRGVLAVFVFTHHFFYVFYPDIIFGGQYEEYLQKGMSLNKWFAFTPLNIFFNPGTAIHFFFILSGYVQSFHYLKNPELSILQKSFVKRYFRLAIPIVAVLLIIFICHKFNLITKHLVPADPITGGWTKSMLQEGIGFPGLIKNGLLDVFYNNYKYYPVLWTMPIELLNSWMVLIILFVTHGLKNRAKLIIAWILVQLFITQSYYSVAFSFGVLICYAEINSLNFRELFSRPLVKFFCFLIGIYFASYPFIGYENSTIHGFYKPISFFEKYPHIISYLFGDLLLFCLILRSEVIKKLLSKKIFRFYGDISFMLYLIHLLVVLSFSPWLYHVLEAHMGKKLNLTLTGLLTFVVVTAASHLLYKYIDKPCLRWCTFYSKKIFGL